ncbi:hypothetical protein EPO05_00910 [Patescibacteria group bacterium]|nr:MAG: hypothetical protein EPO05_00910 [Patescibacteria group bacterium]
MRTYIDLLPEQKKTEISRSKTVRMIVAQEFGLAFPVFLLVVILFSVQLILKIQNESLEAIYNEEQSQGGYQELRRFEEKFKEINSKIDLVSKIQQNHLDWSGALVKLSQLTPDGITVTGLITKEYRIFLVGKAKARDDLLDFEQTLNDSDCFTEVNMPLSNLVSKSDVDFQFDFKVKEACILSQ